LLDRTNPRDEVVLRHYTISARLPSITAAHTIWGTLGGTFGDGVYFVTADARFPVPRITGTPRQIGCPLGPQEQESVWYYLQLDGAPGTQPPGYYDSYANATRISDAYIDILLDRANEPGFEGPFPNTFGGLEYVFRSPKLTPPFGGEPRPFRVFTEDQKLDTCPPGF